MNKIKKLLLILTSLLILNSCNSYCIPYGYFEFKSRDSKIDNIGKLDPVLIKNLSDAKKFPSSYRVDKGRYYLLVNQILERDYPTIHIQAKSRDETTVHLKLHNDNECFYSTNDAEGGPYELLWRSDNKSCGTHYPIIAKVKNSKGVVLETFNLQVYLRQNGQRCSLDAI